VLGKAKPILRRKQYRVISRLLEAGRRGLSKPQLQMICGDAIGILDRLRKSDPDWASITHFPGRKGSGTYRIAKPS
jgi:hypothetical protein